MQCINMMTTKMIEKLIYCRYIIFFFNSIVAEKVEIIEDQFSLFFLFWFTFIRFYINFSQLDILHSNFL